MQKAFRVPIEALFDEFEEEPVASGSIAQVCITILISSRHITVTGIICAIPYIELQDNLIQCTNLCMFVVVVLHRSIGLC